MTSQHIVNAITVDVEDWAQSVVDASLPVTTRFVPSTFRVLEMFARHGVRGTFFVLGRAAEKAPELIREIHQAGHEIQSHGYIHQPIFTLSKDQFRQDLNRSKKLLEDLIGRPVNGYRAPDFSITLNTIWALDVLVECGYTYDSSIFPVKTSRYGIHNTPRFPYNLRTPAGYSLLELPVASFRFCGVTLPIGGGGYLRLFPYTILRLGLTQINRAGKCTTLYMHPYEYDPTEMEEINLPISVKTRLHQGIGRRGVPCKINSLLEDFSFSTASDVIQNLEDPPWFKHRVGLDG